MDLYVHFPSRPAHRCGIPPTKMQKSDHWEQPACLEYRLIPIKPQRSGSVLHIRSQACSNLLILHMARVRAGSYASGKSGKPQTHIADV